MKKTVYIIGDITKDVYLRLDNHRTPTYQDENGVWWLDLPFDNKIHRYFGRASVYGGAAVSADVLNRFGVEPLISGASTGFDDGGNFAVKSSPYRTYRYIVCRDDDTAVFGPSNVYDTLWVRPTEVPTDIYLDRPCILDENEKNDLLAYLDENPAISLAAWINRDVLVSKKNVERFSRRAELVFANADDLGLSSVDCHAIEKVAAKFHAFGVKTVVMTSGRGLYASHEGKILWVEWSLGEKTGLFTSLTTKAILASSFLGANMLGRDVGSCLLLAKYNVETSTLNSANSLETLDEMIINKQYEVKNMESGKVHNTVMTASRKVESEIEVAPQETLATEEELGKPLDFSTGGDDIRSIAKRLVAAGKGVLAADESGGSIKKKFEERGIEDTEHNRRNYRNIFFTTEGLGDYVNGVILFDETARQLADDGKTFVEYLSGKGIIPGIKVDKGLEDLPRFPGEKVTLGLDELKSRLKEYHDMGCRFAKWRAAFEITDSTPTDAAIAANVQALARYALDCQEAGIVPIVEPEVVYDGDYTIEKNAEVTGRILYALFAELDLLKVDLGGAILKCNMVLAGKKHHTQSTPDEVGAATAKVLRELVPESLAGVVFLSGGQSVAQSTENLQAVTNHGPFPWPVTFSFARALQDPAVETWAGREENVPAAREAFKARLIANAEALTKR